MLSFGFTSFVFVSLYVLGFFIPTTVFALPLNDTQLAHLGPAARSILARAVPTNPRWVIYSDKFVSGLTGPPPVSEVQVSSTVFLSFGLAN